MTEIVPDFRAYCKQDKPLSYNDLGQDYPIKLPTRMREEPLYVGPQSRVP
jgi:hypothetical protein